jgi:hypothetical protein
LTVLKSTEFCDLNAMFCQLGMILLDMGLELGYFAVVLLVFLAAEDRTLELFPVQVLVLLLDLENVRYDVQLLVLLHILYFIF